jgi:hypothetical protein
MGESGAVGGEVRVDRIVFWKMLTRRPLAFCLPPAPQPANSAAN